MSYNKFKDISIKGSDSANGYSLYISGSQYTSNAVVVGGSITSSGININTSLANIQGLSLIHI